MDDSPSPSQSGKSDHLTDETSGSVVQGSTPSRISVRVEALSDLPLRAPPSRQHRGLHSKYSFDSCTTASILRN